ncbi:hypothetical protein [Herpetosiphon sp. NSE202]
MMGMVYRYDPGFFTEIDTEGDRRTLWEVGMNAGQFFFAQIEAFEKIFN